MAGFPVASGVSIGVAASATLPLSWTGSGSTLELAQPATRTALSTTNINNMLRQPVLPFFGIDSYLVSRCFSRYQFIRTGGLKLKQGRDNELVHAGSFQSSHAQKARPMINSLSLSDSHDSSSVNMVKHCRQEQGIRVMSVPQNMRSGPKAS